MGQVFIEPRQLRHRNRFGLRCGCDQAHIEFGNPDRGHGCGADPQASVGQLGDTFEECCVDVITGDSTALIVSQVGAPGAGGCRLRGCFGLEWVRFAAGQRVHGDEGVQRPGRNDVVGGGSDLRA